MNWKIGQTVICVKKGLWYCHETKLYTSHGPKYGENYKIIGITPVYYGLILEGYELVHQGYDSSRFRPLLGDSAKAELISSFTEIKEGSDLPIRMPQPETV